MWGEKRKGVARDVRKLEKRGTRGYADVTNEKRKVECKLQEEKGREEVYVWDEGEEDYGRALRREKWVWVG